MHEKQISDRVKPLAADQPSFWCSYMLVFWQSDLNVGGVVVIAVTLECVMPYESCYRDETSRPFPVGEVVVVLGYTCWGDEWRRLVDASGDLCTALDKIVELQCKIIIRMFIICSERGRVERQNIAGRERNASPHETIALPSNTYLLTE